LFGKKKKKLLTLTHKGFLTSMPLGKYLEYIKEQENAEKNTNCTTTVCCSLL